MIYPKISALGVKQQALDIYIMTETNIKGIYNKNRMYTNIINFTVFGFTNSLNSLKILSYLG
jgi:hypothetical protein